MTQDSPRQPWLASMSTDAYANASDFQEYFKSEMDQLFRLALLLTADAEQAERCLAISMRECLAAEQVYKQWVGVWTRRTITRNGIRIAFAAQHRSIGRADKDTPAIIEPQELLADLPGDSAGVFALNTLDRLVYVLTSVEQYSAAECALLLRKPLHDIHEARKRALVNVAGFEQQCGRTSNGAPAATSSIALENETPCGTLLN